MATEEEIEIERERIRKLVTSLGNVLETIRGTSSDVGSTVIRLKEAQAVLDSAKGEMAQTSSRVLSAVAESLAGLPASISKKMLEELDGAIATTISNSVERLNVASANATTAAKTLQAAIAANWATNRNAAITSGAVAGAVASVLLGIAAGLLFYFSRAQR